MISLVTGCNAMQKLIEYNKLATKGVTYSKVQLWRLERTGKFPRRVKLSSQRVAWVETEIEGWIAAKIAERKS